MRCRSCREVICSSYHASTRHTSPLPPKKVSMNEIPTTKRVWHKEEVCAQPKSTVAPSKLRLRVDGYNATRQKGAEHLKNACTKTRDRHEKGQRRKCTNAKNRLRRFEAHSFSFTATRATYKNDNEDEAGEKLGGTLCICVIYAKNKCVCSVSHSQCGTHSVNLQKKSSWFAESAAKRT